MSSIRSHGRLRCQALVAAVLMFFGTFEALSAQEKPKEPEKQPTVKVQPTYRLQPGDEVTLSVLPQKEYDIAATVLPDGQLNLKNIKEPIKAAGMTLDQLRTLIKKLLDEELVDPMVTL